MGYRPLNLTLLMNDEIIYSRMSHLCLIQQVMRKMTGCPVDNTLVDDLIIPSLMSYKHMRLNSFSIPGEILRDIKIVGRGRGSFVENVSDGDVGVVSREIECLKEVDSSDKKTTVIDIVNGLSSLIHPSVLMIEPMEWNLKNEGDYEGFYDDEDEDSDEVVILFKEVSSIVLRNRLNRCGFVPKGHPRYEYQSSRRDDMIKRIRESDIQTAYDWIDLTIDCGEKILLQPHLDGEDGEIISIQALR
jgi:hypothetical protein